jgi:hypothetical protein
MLTMKIMSAIIFIEIGMIADTRPVSHKENMIKKNKLIDNTSGTLGVSIATKGRYSYWQADIINNNDKRNSIRKQLLLSIQNLGYDRAKKMRFNRNAFGKINMDIYEN